MKLLNFTLSISDHGISHYDVKNGIPSNTLSSLNIHSGINNIDRGVLVNITDSFFQKIGLVKLYNFFKLFKLSNSFVKLLPENDETETGYIVDFQPLCKHDTSIIVELKSDSEEINITKQTTYKSKMYDWKYSCTFAVIHCSEQIKQQFEIIAVSINKSDSKVHIAKGNFAISPKHVSTGNMISKLDFDDYSTLHETTTPMFDYLMKICDNSLSDIILILEDEELKAMHYKNFNTTKYLKNRKPKLNYTKQQLI